MFERYTETARRVIAAAREVARVDVEAALLCFRSGPQALRTTTVEQFERWAADGLALRPSNFSSPRLLFFGWPRASRAPENVAAQWRFDDK